MAFIKAENGDMETVETFRVKEEETEEQTGWFHSQSRTFMDHLIHIRGDSRRAINTEEPILCCLFVKL